MGVTVAFGPVSKATARPSASQVTATEARTSTSNNSVSTEAYDCTQVTIDELDEALLTREERIARMDNSLSESIDQYSVCMSAVTSNASEAGGGQGADGQGGAGQSGTGDAGGVSGDDQNQLGQAQDSQAGSRAVNSQSSTSTPKPRGVIAPKDNDSIICTLLYNEIQSASGASLEGLKKQYEDYKCAG